MLINLMFAVDLDFRRLETETFLALSRIHHEIGRRVEAVFAEAGFDDVTPAQASALLLLFQGRRPLTAREVARELALSEVTVGRFMKALETNGWVERTPDPDDGRAILVRPTARARDALPRFIEISNTLLDQAFAGFERDEVRSLVEAVGRVQANLQGRK